MNRHWYIRGICKVAELQQPFWLFNSTAELPQPFWSTAAQQQPFWAFNSTAAQQRPVYTGFNPWHTLFGQFFMSSAVKPLNYTKLTQDANNFIRKQKQRPSTAAKPGIIPATMGRVLNTAQTKAPAAKPGVRPAAPGTAT